MISPTRLRALLFISVLFCISGCDTPSVYTMKQDAGPKQAMRVDHIPDAVPRVEPRTIAGNKSPYTVLGKTYRVMASPDNYRAAGIASWYGRKFHGHTTSNGEIYNMYGMTAAHKTLPIPSYVRVTNQNNQRSVIVRVNDRGPFHEGRIIDLSYTAAKKLGFVNSGTAPVVVEYIDPVTFNKPVSTQVQPPILTASLNGNRAAAAEPVAPTPTYSAGYELPPNAFLQVGAFSQREVALKLQAKLQALTAYPVVMVEPQSTTLFRVRIGPIKNNFDVLMLREILTQNGLTEAHLVYQ